MDRPDCDALEDYSEKASVGFENSLWHMDGELAVDNAERVREVEAVIRNVAPS